MENTHETLTSQAPAKALALTGLFAALSCAGTLALQVPSPTGGYLNLGDAVVILGAWLLGPAYGAVAGGIGPAMADLLSGYAAYVPATLIIKALMAVTAAGLYQALGKRGLILCAAAAEIPMVAGYWLFDALLVSLSSGAALPLCLAGSAAGIPSNLVQAVFGAAASTLLAMALRRSTAVRRQFPRL
ncbi:MAG: ECF transporter S component [Oscillibacter sp.]|nr:ECF transporter S component [Oscillibacter sp.]